MNISQLGTGIFQTDFERTLIQRKGSHRPQGKGLGCPFRAFKRGIYGKKILLAEAESGLVFR